MASVDYLYVISNRKVNQVSLAYKRPLFYQINWDNRLDEIHKYRNWQRQQNSFVAVRFY